MNKGIIDAHTHMFPEEVIQNWEHFADRDPYFKLLTQKIPGSTGTEEAYATAPEALEAADAAGVEKLVMQGWYWNDPELCKYHNDYMHEVSKRCPGRFVPYAAINPKMGEAAINELERCHSLGFAGVGELGPGGNGFDFNDHSFLRVLEATEYYRMPVNIHCGEPVGHLYPGKDSTPLEPLINVARRFPELRLILAHQGGGLPFYEIYPEIKEAFRHVYYDLAANPLLYRIESVKCAVEFAGADKVIYGSDFPLLLYPRRCRKMDFSLFISDIRENAGLTEAEERMILQDNMRELIDFAKNSDR